MFNAISAIKPEINMSEIKSIIASNLSDNFKNLPPEIVDKIGTLITLLKAIGIIFIIYLVFLIVRSILNIIEKRRIKRIHDTVMEMDKKLDMLLEKSKVKSEKKDKKNSSIL